MLGVFGICNRGDCSRGGRYLNCFSQTTPTLQPRDSSTLRNLLARCHWIGKSESDTCEVEDFGSLQFFYLPFNFSENRCQ